MIEHLHLGGSDISIFQTAKSGNWCTGDDYFATNHRGVITCALVDGLGSGEAAMEAAKTATSAVASRVDDELDDIVQACNSQMGGTRGVVLSILRIYPQERKCEYVNVGNINCHVYQKNGEVIHPVPNRGYLSGRRIKPRVERWTMEADMVFSMYSDGFPANPLTYPYFHYEETPENMMNRLVEDFQYLDDDASVMIGKTPM
ncbi:SpoIIE family protein phosphatase [Alkalicoccus chagannorensis]|uniref:SpoIIE family protein phosphatase n=1 Tax=Alkalicoccus chagannorensis TaxID=427072 RepID=UPI0004278369|nr:SpoIIE family protein phosphatase [Alkalicoccus chagannorensis]